MDTDHAPVGDVAFRCTSEDLLQSALAIWGEATQAEVDIAEVLVHQAMYYEGIARTWDEIRNLPETPKLPSVFRRYC